MASPPLPPTQPYWIRHRKSAVIGIAALALLCLVTGGVVAMRAVINARPGPDAAPGRWHGVPLDPAARVQAEDEVEIRLVVDRPPDRALRWFDESWQREGMRIAGRNALLGDETWTYEDAQRRVTIAASGYPGDAQRAYVTITDERLAQAPRITSAVTARGIDNRNQPSPTASEATVNSALYITYVARNVKRGQKVRIRLLRDGQPQSVSGGETTITQDYTTLNGYFRYQPTQRGEYTAELYLDAEPTPSRTVTFTVR